MGYSHRLLLLLHPQTDENKHSKQVILQDGQLNGLRMSVFFSPETNVLGRNGTGSSMCFGKCVSMLLPGNKPAQKE